MKQLLIDTTVFPIFLMAVATGFTFFVAWICELSRGDIAPYVLVSTSVVGIAAGGWVALENGMNGRYE